MIEIKSDQSILLDTPVDQRSRLDIYTIHFLELIVFHAHELSSLAALRETDWNFRASAIPSTTATSFASRYLRPEEIERPDAQSALKPARCAIAAERVMGSHKE